MTRYIKRELSLISVSCTSLEDFPTTKDNSDICKNTMNVLIKQ